MITVKSWLCLVMSNKLSHSGFTAIIIISSVMSKRFGVIIKVFPAVGAPTPRDLVQIC